MSNVNALILATCSQSVSIGVHPWLNRFSQGERLVRQQKLSVASATSCSNEVQVSVLTF